MFVRGGHVRPGKYLDLASLEGYYWSSDSINSDLAYRLLFALDGVYPSDYYLRELGFSIRCVAIGG